MATAASVVPAASVRHGFHDPAYPEHLGADLEAPAGSLVYSPVAGTVTFAGTDDASGDGGLGVKIATEDGASVGVWHLSSTAVSVGAHVPAGQIVGYSGQTGNASYPHVHLQVELPPGNPIDPLAYLAGLDGGGSSWWPYALAALALIVIIGRR